MAAPLIPGVFPFTADEVREAVRRWLPPDESKEAAERFVRDAAEALERHAEVAARLGGAGQNSERFFGSFHAPDELLAHLTLVSPDAAARVEVIVQRRWAELRARELEIESRRAAERAGLIPSMDDLLDAAERSGKFSWDDPKVFRGLAASGLRLPAVPEPPPEVIATVDAHVAEDVARWEALVAAVRSGTPRPEPEPNMILDREEALPQEMLPGPESDWAFIDEYIDRHDRHRRGEWRLFGRLARDLPRFNAELVRALRVAPARAVPRVVTYKLLDGPNGAVPLDSPVGVALRDALGTDAPPRTTRRHDEHYAAADLLEWYEAARSRFEPYPRFDEWRGRPRTRRDVSFMRLVRDRWGELFPEEPFEEDSDDTDESQ